MLKDILFEKQEEEVYKKQWTFEPQWLLSGLNTPVCAQILVDKQHFTIGIDKDNDAVLDFDHAISKRHITLDCDEDGCVLRDENSTNGTYINGKRMESGSAVRLKSGDTIKMATSCFLAEKLHREEAL